MTSDKLRFRFHMPAFIDMDPPAPIMFTDFADLRAQSERVRSWEAAPDFDHWCHSHSDYGALGKQTTLMAQMKASFWVVGFIDGALVTLGLPKWDSVEAPKRSEAARQALRAKIRRAADSGADSTSPDLTSYCVYAAHDGLPLNVTIKRHGVTATFVHPDECSSVAHQRVVELTQEVERLKTLNRGLGAKIRADYDAVQRKAIEDRLSEVFAESYREVPAGLFADLREP